MGPVAPGLLEAQAYASIGMELEALLAQRGPLITPSQPPRGCSLALITPSDQPAAGQIQRSYVLGAEGGANAGLSGQGRGEW